MLTLTDTGTRAVSAAAVGGYLTGERELAEAPVPETGPGMLVLMDWAFPSVRLLGAFAGRGSAVVMRAARHIARTPAALLPDGGYLAEIRANGRTDRGAERVTVRVVEYQVEDGERIRLITNLLDPRSAPAAELAALYRQRWEAEAGNRQIKVFQQGRGYVLRSGTPDLVRQEIWAHLTVHLCLTRLATVIADERRIDPDRILLTKVLKQARRTVIAQTAATLATARRIALDIADDLRRYANPKRRTRTAPRSLKRRRDRYPIRPTATGPVTIEPVR